MRTLDIIVPSYRLDLTPLKAILSLTPPPGVSVRWMVVVDNPNLTIPVDLRERADGTRVVVVQNQANLGSAAARNVALDHSTAEWVLFLDDDVMPTRDLLMHYVEAVARHPHSTGFFGPTRFAPGSTRYQRGVEVSDILTFFRIAEKPCSLAWAPTSNVLVRGDAARSERFRTVFPKGGGGEDIDFLLRVSRRFRSTFESVPSAVVDHPWWFCGRRDYSRFMRWSYGDSLLHALHPEFVYRAAPNAVEVLAVAIPSLGVLALATGSLIPLAAATAGIVVGEIAAEFVRLAALKSFRDAFFCVETVLIRSANDAGRLAMHIRSGRWLGLTERWDHFCNGEHVSYHKRWASRKFIAHGMCAFAIYLIAARVFDSV
jgi:glycosyltransferase involved in cell wall biosynthesis